jgi:hypothetical protein
LLKQKLTAKNISSISGTVLDKMTRKSLDEIAYEMCRKLVIM